MNCSPSLRFSSLALALATITACSAARPAPELPSQPELAPEEQPAEQAAVTDEAEPVVTEASPEERQLGLARGGRLFDKWWKEKNAEFTPDDPQTPELDGKGGPFGNGTLAGADGKPMANTGHDYRLKNLLGWDLRGSEGIYGKKYQDKPYVLELNALTASHDASQWAELLSAGGEGLPAYGAVLSTEEIKLVSTFLESMSQGERVGPGSVFNLSESAPKNYTLLSGGNPERGRELIEEKCVNCHGDDGTSFYIDQKYSVGAYARSKGYEAWIKVLNGHPGTKMGPQLPHGESVAEQSQSLKDILSALCDRSAFPAGEGKGQDVPDGDLRCGEYLK